MSEINTEYETFLKSLIILLQKELSHINEIYNLTKELSQALSRNDNTSARMILKMRGKEIIEVDKITRKITSIINSLKSEKDRINNLIKGIELENMTILENKICMIGKSMRESNKKTVEIDKNISVRLAGDKSFYL